MTIIDAEIIDEDASLETKEDELPNEEEVSKKHGFVKMLVRTSVKFVVAGSIASIAPEAETKIQKAKLAVGSYVLADMVSRSTEPYVEQKIETWKEDLREARDFVQKVNAYVKGIENDPETPDTGK